MENNEKSKITLLDIIFGNIPKDSKIKEKENKKDEYEAYQFEEEELEEDDYYYEVPD